MKKVDVVNLIKYHYQGKNDEFQNLAFMFAKEFEKDNDLYAAGLIESIINSNYSFSTQHCSDNDSMLEKINTNLVHPLYLSDALSEDIFGVINALNKKINVRRFLFLGKPGTGKTEAAKYIANDTKRKLYSVNFASLIDSKLGETLKNIEKLFAYIETAFDLSKTIFLFDELDLIALDRINRNDIREMGRASSLFIKCLDRLNENAVIIATSNLGNQIDKAIKRRFDFEIDFDQYSSKDLSEIASSVVKEYKNGDVSTFETKMIKKIALQLDDSFSPSEIRNVIKISLAFSNPNDKFDYLRRMYVNFFSKFNGGLDDVLTLKNKFRFTLREIEIITSIPIASLSRNIKINGESSNDK